ncbi:MAG: hypothetical protein H7062_19590 [Candidatus Saccharimonas sp.]|nr:hypothetical protein [Planctomycetaceae bacterium]
MPHFVFAIICSIALLGGIVHSQDPVVPRNDLPVVLLVHGMKFDLNSPTNVWGRPATGVTQSDGTGVIGRLEAAGLPFGGVLRARNGKVLVPEVVSPSSVEAVVLKSAGTRTARVFALEFSRAANVDGLAYKALELAACATELHRSTGRRVCIVAHSAGGLAARAWLQNALPGVEYDGAVDRVLTISTPHLGSGKAEHWGDFLGTRATSLKPDSELIRRMNNELLLPAEVKFASIVVRGLAVGVTGLHEQESAVTPFVRKERLEHWPLDFQRGTDQIVDVRTQNLRLTKCADDYEAATRRPVVTLLARVPDPTPEDRLPRELTVHESAPRHDSVLDLVQLLILGDEAESPWASGVCCETQWLDRQLRLHAAGIAENAVAQRQTLSEVRGTILDEWRVEANGADETVLHFACRSASRHRALGLDNKTMLVRGTLTVSVDRFGRSTVIREEILNIRSE